MSSIKSSTRIALSAGAITVSVIWLALGLNLFPDAVRSKLAGRVDLFKAISVNATVLVKQHHEREFEAFLVGVCKANPDIVSCGIRSKEGDLQFSVGDHATLWNADQTSPDGDQMAVQIFDGDRPWGTLEIKFSPIQETGWHHWFAFPLPLVLFCGALVMLLNWSYLGQTLRQFNPSRVVPQRVRVAFDALTDGLMLVDTDFQIVMANQAFERMANMSERELQAKTINDFDWEVNGEKLGAGEAPWHRCLKQMETLRGELIWLRRDQKQVMRYAVSTTPITGLDGGCRGALVSFHDVTALETKKEQLGKMLLELAASRDEVQQKNRDLQILASTDPLTGCLNRRSFFEQFRKVWESHAGQPLSAIMVDIDHFKSVNDRYGHSTGDVVLQATGQLLLETSGEDAIVGRYGGEEFVIALPNVGLEQATEFAERLRLQLIELKPAEVEITMSVGVSARDQGALDSQHLIDQADQSLYIAKREGRNRVQRWDQCNTSALLLADNAQWKSTGQGDSWEYHRQNFIQYPAVTAMLSALAFRDHDTAVHSTRVAKLCLLVGRRLMNLHELYELEIAALLHDIGKIGVPDAILRKPGPLTPDEWTVMNRHDQIGVEIVRSAFASERIIEYIRCHHLHYSNALELPSAEVDKVIPLGARIITVCDAFDAMTNDRVFRNAISQDKALAELYRWSTVQFDPLIVRTLERVVKEDKLDLSEIQAERSALKLGVYVEQLTVALASGNVKELADVTRHVESVASEFNIQPLLKAATDLETRLAENNSNLSQLGQLADDILDICRSSRSAIVDNPEVLRSAGELTVKEKRSQSSP